MNASSSVRESTLDEMFTGHPLEAVLREMFAVLLDEERAELAAMAA